MGYQNMGNFHPFTVKTGLALDIPIVSPYVKSYDSIILLGPKIERTPLPIPQVPWLLVLFLDTLTFKSILKSPAMIGVEVNPISPPLLAHKACVDQFMVRSLRIQTVLKYLKPGFHFQLHNRSPSKPRPRPYVITTLNRYRFLWGGYFGFKLAYSIRTHALVHTLRHLPIAVAANIACNFGYGPRHYPTCAQTGTAICKNGITKAWVKHIGYKTLAEAKDSK